MVVLLAEVMVKSVVRSLVLVVMVVVGQMREVGVMEDWANAVVKSVLRGVTVMVVDVVVVCAAEGISLVRRLGVLVRKMMRKNLN